MNYKLDVELSEELEPYRSAIEATIKPYIKIELTNNNNPTNQDKFRVIYFPQIDLEIDNLITDFSFLPKLESEDWLMPFQGCCGLELAIALFLDTTFEFMAIALSKKIK